MTRRPCSLLILSATCFNQDVVCVSRVAFPSLWLGLNSVLWTMNKLKQCLVHQWIVCCGGLVLWFWGGFRESLSLAHKKSRKQLTTIWDILQANTKKVYNCLNEWIGMVIKWMSKLQSNVQQVVVNCWLFTQENPSRWEWIRGMFEISGLVHQA